MHDIDQVSHIAFETGGSKSKCKMSFVFYKRLILNILNNMFFLLLLFLNIAIYCKYFQVTLIYFKLYYCISLYFSPTKIISHVMQWWINDWL